MNSTELARRIRAHSLRMTHRAKTSHIGSCLSVADILAVLYADVVGPDDKVILSKGHAAAALYACLAEIEGSTNELDEFCREHSMMYWHVKANLEWPNGVHCSTGSLGHGLPIACGMALAKKIRGESGRVFCIMSDGELQEGSVWEAANFASWNDLDNLTAIVDWNGLQGLGRTLTHQGSDIEKFKAFGWRTHSISGHNHDLLRTIFAHENVDVPAILVCSTDKGKGVYFMENRVGWHYKSVNDEELALALKEIGDGVG